MPPPATVLIADDHPIVLEGLVALLQGSQHAVVARCTSGAEVLEALQRVEPDILVLDLNMPPPDALELARGLKERDHPAKIVLLTSDLADGELVEAMRLAIPGIVLKETAAQQLIACLDAVRAGQRWFDAEIARRAMDTVVWHAPAHRAADRLAPRELEVAKLVARGLRNKEVARELAITEGTVKVYLHNVYEKLNVASRVELANIVREQGLV
jgi:two-component system, NarL family, nitrate/nitrite response regulator NarL